MEGEGALHIRVRGDDVDEVRLDIYEPPRFFEAFLRGRSYREPPDITSRICGICPVAYQTSAFLAIEAACGVQVDGPIADLRRLLYCGEWIASHALHIYMLHAPDFLGYPGAVELARDHREVVERGLALRRAGNAIMETIGGRAVHPVNVQVGGFYSVPGRRDLAVLAGQLRAAMEQALATVRWVAGFDFPELTVGHEMLALRQPGRYADRGRHRRDDGRTRVPGRRLRAARAGGAGPALDRAACPAGRSPGHLPHRAAGRYTLNSGLLPPLAAGRGGGRGTRPDLPQSVPQHHRARRRGGLRRRGGDPHHRGVRAAGRGQRRRARRGPRTGHGVSEAPRGVLYQRYELDADGHHTRRPDRAADIAESGGDRARSRAVRAGAAELDDESLTRACERAIRNYDPCISCATHFLTLSVDRA